MASGSFCLIYFIWCVCCLKKAALISCSPLFGEDYLPWAPLFGEDYLPWVPETIENKGFGHQKTRWFAILGAHGMSTNICWRKRWLKIPSRTVELLTDGSSEGLTKILSCKGEVLDFFFHVEAFIFMAYERPIAKLFQPFWDYYYLGKISRSNFYFGVWNG